ncbi:MAG TPA: D-alanyl-D-alanine carboxypeptidase/D-alanyl-D-alanine-endopeptidase [Gemmataceae bacterium]|jgi:D-alanyl-D-alanine carboxypeptidase/D-alanyl-D-alanine-endopeptidase (penicillin-binding protein 4)|nr:D-alanyl-D-alanine carboxypeptidase/D-alanyl-D-alanine-endopeptidase [Gemmataceae bacterium]
MKRRTGKIFTIGLLLWVIAGAGAHAGEDLAAKIETIISGPDYKQAHWGLLVVDSQTGETIYAHNPDHLFFPASTTKLYSCSTALATLGPDYRFETSVYRRGKLKDGRLDGDLILVASGDLTMGGRTLPDGTMAFKDNDHTYANGNEKAQLTETDPLAGLKSLAKQIAAAGIQHINGDILIDDRLFAHARGSGSGPDMLSPIIINDNVVDVVITPAAEAGQPAKIHMRPETAFMQMDALVDTVSADKKAHLEIRHAAPRSFVVRGQIPVKAQPLVRIYAIENPADFARALFIDTLRREGISLSASPFQPPTAELPEKGSYSKADQVASFRSPPFSEAVKVTLKVSHNLYASTLPLLVAARNGKRTLADGLHLQRKQLQDLGVDVTTISFGGGAGGANADAVTPRASVQLLRALARRPDYKALEAGLPILGVDGTLAEAVPPDSPAKGKVRAKTGTLYWHDVMNERALLTSKALAGTMTTAKGRSLTLAIYVNGVPLPKNVTPTREGKAIGKLCEIIYLNAP